VEQTLLIIVLALLAGFDRAGFFGNASAAPPRTPSRSRASLCRARCRSRCWWACVRQRRARVRRPGLHLARQRRQLADRGRVSSSTDLSALMMVVVTSVSLDGACVHHRLHGRRPGLYQRFFSYISLFTFSMLMLVMSNNLVQLFFGWEAVGLVSYLLIGFWYTRPSAIFANLKAFLVNRVGDFGFLLGIAGIVYLTGSLHYAEVFAQADTIAGGARSTCLRATRGSVATLAASACSSARWASRPRCRCTSGCRIRWKARRRSRR
jgi:hypothetical protein